MDYAPDVKDQLGKIDAYGISQNLDPVRRKEAMRKFLHFKNLKAPDEEQAQLQGSITGGEPSVFRQNVGALIQGAKQAPLVGLQFPFTFGEQETKKSAEDIAKGMEAKGLPVPSATAQSPEEKAKGEYFLNPTPENLSKWNALKEAPASTFIKGALGLQGETPREQYVEKNAPIGLPVAGAYHSIVDLAKGIPQMAIQSVKTIGEMIQNKKITPAEGTNLVFTALIGAGVAKDVASGMAPKIVEGQFPTLPEKPADLTMLGTQQGLTGTEPVAPKVSPQTPTEGLQAPPAQAEGITLQPPEATVSSPAPQTPPLAETPVAGKELWQMSQKEFIVDGKQRLGTDFDKLGNATVKALHKSEIRQALSSGKPVPPEVLADYPDLARGQGIGGTQPAGEGPQVGGLPGGLPRAGEGITRGGMAIKDFPETVSNPVAELSKKYVDSYNLKVTLPEGADALVLRASELLNQDPQWQEFAKSVPRELMKDRAIAANYTPEDINNAAQFLTQAETHYAGAGLALEGTIRDLTKTLPDMTDEEATLAIKKFMQIYNPYNRLSKTFGRIGNALQIKGGAGRSLLAQMKDLARRGDISDMEDIPKITPQTIAKVKELFENSASESGGVDPGKIGELVNHPSFWDKVFYWRQMGWLSGPRTILKIFDSNVIMTALRQGEAGAKEGLSAVGIGPKMAPGESVLPEIYRAKSWLEGLKAISNRDAMSIYRDIEEVDKAFKPVIRKAPFESKAGQLVGKAVSKIPQLHMALHTGIFRSSNFLWRMREYAYRQAVSEEGLKGFSNEAIERAEEIFKNPTKELKGWQDKTLGAIEEAQKSTFLNALKDEGIAGIFKKIHEHPVGRFVIPFPRIQYNIPARFLEYSPANFLRIIKRQVGPEIPKDNFWGGLLGDKEKFTPEELQSQLAKGVVGTGVATGLYLLKNHFTGSGRSLTPGQRQEKQRMGWKPNSVRLDIPGGKNIYIPHFYFEPVTTYLGILGEMNEIDQYQKPLPHPSLEDKFVRAFENTARAFGENFLSKGVAQGITQVVDLLQNPVMNAKSYLHQQARGLVPVGVATAAQITDPYLREANTLLDEIQSGIPGWRNSLPYKIDRWGKPIRSSPQGGLLGGGERAFGGGEQVSDPVDVELERLGVYPAMPNKMVKVKGKPLAQSVPLTPQEYHHLVTEMGPQEHEALLNYINSPGYQNVKGDWRASADERRALALKGELRRLNSLWGKKKNIEMAEGLLGTTPTGAVP